MTHAEARQVILAAYRAVFGKEPSRAVAQALQGIGWLETNYGQGWKGSGKGSNNWGAIQRGRPPCDPANSFTYTDTHPNPDGSSTPYTICFRKYATPQDGARDLAIVVYQKRASVLRAAEAGDLYGVSAALHATRYYEGFGKTVADRINNHYKALTAAVRLQAKALQEPMPDGSTPPPPVLKRGSHGEAVKDLQRLLNMDLPFPGEFCHPDVLAVDGQFGPNVEKRVRQFQSENTWEGKPLKVDGVVGEKTWGALKEATSGEAVFELD